MKIIEKFMTNNDCYKLNAPMQPKGLMLHSVGCPQPNPLVFFNNQNISGVEVAVHAYIGAEDTVYQYLPWNIKGWHAGGKANGTHIGVEMTEPSCIKYTKGSTFTCSDVSAAKAHAEKTYKTAVELFAFLCKEYGLNPLTDIIGHAEGHKMGVASNHGDPEHIWKQLNMGLTMDTFRKAVKKAMDNSAKDDADVIYRVQVGAYKKKSNAEAMLDKLKKAGFDGYITTATAKTTATTEVPKNTLKVGDMVSLSADATVYGSSLKFKSWVYDSTLYVRQVDGDKIVISTLKTGAVTGATHKKYLTKI